MCERLFLIHKHDHRFNTIPDTIQKQYHKTMGKYDVNLKKKNKKKPFNACRIV